jgi:hypothetical protein
VPHQPLAYGVATRILHHGGVGGVAFGGTVDVDAPSAGSVKSGISIV